MHAPTDALVPAIEIVVSDLATTTDSSPIESCNVDTYALSIDSMPELEQTREC